MIDCFGFIGHWNPLIKCLALIARVANGCTYAICLNSAAKGCEGYLQEFWTLSFVKHGSTGDGKDDESHGKEGGEIGYRR